MRIVYATCAVDYSGRLDAHLEPAKRALMIKADGAVLVHADGGSYKPLNWMSPPCTMTVDEPSDEERESGVSEVWRVDHDKTDDALLIQIYEIHDEMTLDLGQEPGLFKDGVEDHLQKLLSEQTDILGKDVRLIRREYPTAIGPVDLLVKDGSGHIAVEVKRRGEIDGVEQLTRYLTLLERDSTLQPIRGIFAAQEIRPQARVLAEDRGIECVVLDYDAMRGVDNPEDRLF
ncbi:endonuclease NucS [Trueperella sp.]|uniref:endonuclease NucS n=1 Tax=Trueperella sp. TaxID=2699835 RepID=UPI003736ACC0